MKDTRFTYEAPELKVYFLAVQNCIAASMGSDQLPAWEDGGELD